MDDYIITIQLDINDLNNLKQMTRIATSRDNTFITFPSTLISDMSGNQVVEVINGRGIQVTTFTGDLIRPMLVDFHLDMDLGQLHLTFDETVNASSFDVTQITVQDDRTNLMNRTRQLTSESMDILGLDDTIISVQLGDSDLNFIKATEMFGLSTTDTWIVITEGLVSDMSKNPVVAVPDGRALQAGNFTADVTRPFLGSYHFDFIVEEMTLHFNEPINVSMINYTAITVQDALNASDFYTLTGGTAISYNNSLTIVISFNEEDINFFKMHPSLTTSVDDTHLTITRDAFFDLATVPNPIIPLINGINATQASGFVYYNAPVFTSVIPAAGRSIGGTVLTISGGNFGSLAGEAGARQVDVLVDFELAINTTVIESNTTLSTISPPPRNPAAIGVPLTLTITVDNSALMLNISEAFTYLPPPNITRLFPTAGTRFGGTLLTIYGNNFGPSTASGLGPEVSVSINAASCENVTVINGTMLTCITPQLEPAMYNVTVTIDQVSVTAVDAFRTLERATVTSITPESTYRDTPTPIRITGDGFGPTTLSQNVHPVQVFLVSQFNMSECSEPLVLVEDTLISCQAEPNLGPSNISVIVDGIESNSSSVVFFHYDNAGNFSFQVEEFFVSEVDMFANVTVIRHDYPDFASPANVSILAYDGSAVSGAHFDATNQTRNMAYQENSVVFQIRITAASYLPDQLRKGVEDDVTVNLAITEVLPLHGSAVVERRNATLTIKAVCQVVSNVCIADWNVLLNQVVYYRLDELP